jgi:hypothetical protein
MSIASVAELQAFSGLQNEESGGVLYQLFLDAAEQVVVDYLGYAPAQAARTETYYGDGKDYLPVRAPVISITSISVDGVAKTVSDFLASDNLITEKNGNPFPAGTVVMVVYSGGFASVPAVIKMVELEIAALMAQEKNGNIGVNGVSSPDGGSRTFVSYTNYQKYLAKLAGLATVIIPRLSP